MTEPSIDSTEAALRRLSFQYACSADDGDAFAAAFEPDGVLQVFRPGDGENPSTVTVGRAALSGIPLMLTERYSRTFHVVRQALYTLDAQSAQGLVYCVSNHLNVRPDGGANHVMHMRYHDDYRYSEDAGWKIARRAARFCWTETRPIDTAGEQSH